MSIPGAKLPWITVDGYVAVHMDNLTIVEAVQGVNVLVKDESTS